MKRTTKRTLAVGGLALAFLLASRPTSSTCSATGWVQCFSWTTSTSGTTLSVTPHFNQSDSEGICPNIPGGTLYACATSCTGNGPTIGFESLCKPFTINQNGSTNPTTLQFTYNNTPQSLIHIFYDSFAP